VELSEWDMERPKVSTQVTQGVPVQAEAFADPHAGCTKQKEGVGQEIICMAQFAAQKAVDFRREGPW